MRSENGLPRGWVETTLGEVVNIIGGGTPKTSVSEYWNGDIPWLSVVDFNNDNRWVYNAEKSITKLGLKNSSTKLLKSGDIIISARGTVGAMAQLKNEMAFNQSCYGIREVENVSDVNFLFYLIKYSLKLIKRNVYGAVFDTIKTKTFDIININLPTLPEQKDIASILTSFDDKIELLQAQNETLETIAQTIFKEWFGKYQVGDELPEGWRVGEYQEIVNLSSGKGVNKSEYIDYGKYEIIGANGTLGRLDKFLTEEKLIVTGRVGTLGTVFIINKPVWISDNVLISRPKHRNLFYFSYFTLKRFNFIALNTGSTQPLITQGDLKSVEIIIPNENILHSFEKVCSKLFWKIEYNSIQIQTLQATRDTLLPKLMSGQLRVAEFKEQLSEVM